MQVVQASKGAAGAALQSAQKLIPESHFWQAPAGSRKYPAAHCVHWTVTANAQRMQFGLPKLHA
jgi:hypothetical protein